MVSFRYRPSRGAVFAALMIASVIGLFLPPEWSDKAKGVAQFLAPAQDLLYSAGHQTSRSMSELERGQMSEQPDGQELLLQLASVTARNQDLQAENDLLRRLRHDAFIPSDVPLLPARVVAQDVAAWRDSVLLQRGSLRSVRKEDWVSSRFLVNRGALSGVEANQAVLALESLLGRVELVSPYMSRVRLFTDVDSAPIEVRIATFSSTEKTPDGREHRVLAFVDYPCSLRGRGRGKMGIEDVPYRYVESDGETDGEKERSRARVGDLVFTATDELGLPVPMVVGRISEISQNPKKRLVYDLVVEPVIAVDEVREVFIIPLLPLPGMPMPE